MADSHTTTNLLFEALNPIQREAVQQAQGPVLILAGAGSGKTRVLTYRVAYLIQHLGVRPYEILAMTFTNKAAHEMKERILTLAKGNGKDIWVGTFHSVCARILRIEAAYLGYERNFVIYDRDDQIRFIKGVMKELRIPESEANPSAVQTRISGAKNRFIGPSEFKSQTRDVFEENVALIYPHYQDQLRRSNAMDFDDLLINPIHLFDQNPDLLSKYQDRFKYLLVDEYQDTNRTQYLLLKQLAAKHHNLCVVGDDDQSIYRWRGANIENILVIDKDYPECKVFHLEQNYRSTKHILDAAHSVVQNNRQRREKRLWTEKDAGEKVHIMDTPDDRSEALVIVNQIKQELSEHHRNFRDFVVLYRTNAQSRVLEDGLRAAGIPYLIVGGVKFYERKEVKDVLAYLQLICNARDAISFKRVINYPLRGIGDASVAKIEQFAAEHGISLLQAAKRAEEIDTISPRIRANITAFSNLIHKYASLKEQLSPDELVSVLVDELGILRSFKEIGTEEAFMRSENVKELLSAISNFGKEHKGATLEQFLEEVSLLTDIDTWDDRSNAVTLMTLHSAKGLEFPVVFITGLEEGLFPLSRTFLSEEELEEERRLFYVGATRAQEKLILTWAARRLRYGDYLDNLPSRFLEELDERFVLRQNLRQVHDGASQRSGRRPRPSPSLRQDMPAYEDFSQELPRIYVGCEVKHPKFGLGKITRKEGSGEHTKIVVKFYDVGEKKLVVKYANLEFLH